MCAGIWKAGARFVGIPHRYPFYWSNSLCWDTAHVSISQNMYVVGTPDTYPNIEPNIAIQAGRQGEKTGIPTYRQAYIHTYMHTYNDVCKCTLICNG